MKKSCTKYMKSMIEYFLPNNFVMCRKNSIAKNIALTFDDGPNKDNTESILGVLKKHGVKATFFVIGKEAERHPELVKSIMRDGHEIANHSYSHIKNASIEDVIRGKEVIEAISEVNVDLFRPPWGKLNLIGLWYAFRNKLKLVLWSFEGCDDIHTDSESLKNYIKRSEIKSGAIMLFHDDYSHTKEALEGIITDIRSRGLNFVTVSGLLESRE